MNISNFHLIVLMCLPFLSISVKGQTEGQTHIVDKNNMHQWQTISEPTLGNLIMHNPAQFNKLAPYTDTGKGRADSLTIRFDKPILTSTPYPIVAISENSPFRHDFITSDFIPISIHSGIGTFARYHTYLTIGSVADVGATYSHTFGRWSINGGVFASKYSTMAREPKIPPGRPGIFNDYGFNGSVDFMVNNRFTLTAFGQYSFNGQKNAAASYLMPLMTPQSRFGFTVDTKVNSWLNVVSGFQHYYDPARMKWRTSPILYPEINLSRLFR